MGISLRKLHAAKIEDLIAAALKNYVPKPPDVSAQEILEREAGERKSPLQQLREATAKAQNNRTGE